MFLCLHCPAFAFYLQHTTQTSMPPARFEPAIPASERLQTCALGRAATGIAGFFLSFFLSFAVLFIDYVPVRPLSSCHLFLYDTQHKHPFHRWDSNPRCQPAIGRRPSHPTARPLGCAHDPLAFESFPLLSVLRYRCSFCSRTTPPAFLPVGQSVLSLQHCSCFQIVFNP